jgi:hypothetical protein
MIYIVVIKETGMDTNEQIVVRKRQNKWAYWILAVGIVLFAAAFVIGINDNIPGIVALLVGALGIALGILLRFTRPRSSRISLQLLYWIPRALCIVFALFVSLFALDVFGEGRGFWGTLGALAVHLIPTYIIIVVLAVTWRWEWVGGVLFIALAGLYIDRFWGRFPFGTYAVICGPLLMMGALFLLNWMYRRTLRPRNDALPQI